MDSTDENGYSYTGFIKHNCIFVHIPKCAGLSIAQSLFNNLGGGHFSLAEYQLVFPKKDFEKFFKFTFVRNPWDRLASSFFFLKRGGLIPADKIWAEKNLADYHDLNTFVQKWVNRENIYKIIHFFPQYSFFYDPDHVTHIDYIGRFENLRDDFKYVADKIGVTASLSFMNKNKDNVQNYKQYYDRKSMEIVEEVYEDDIRLFNYSLPDKVQNLYHNGHKEHKGKS